ncbi:MAG: hypothetical protein ACI37V_00105, partial [Methanobrevibacter sp.]
MGLFDFLKKDKKENKEDIQSNNSDSYNEGKYDIDDLLESDQLSTKQKQQIMYKEFAENSENRNERLTAVNEIMDVNMLEDIAINFKDRYSRLLAVAKIQDEDVLYNIAENSKYSETRAVAYEHLGRTDKASEEILINNNNKKESINNYLKNIDNEDILTNIAIKSIDKKARNSAFNMIENK